MLLERLPQCTRRGDGAKTLFLPWLVGGETRDKGGEGVWSGVEAAAAATAAAAAAAAAANRPLEGMGLWVSPRWSVQPRQRSCARARMATSLAVAARCG